jgi:hypothetical protein
VSCGCLSLLFADVDLVDAQLADGEGDSDCVSAVSGAEALEDLGEVPVDGAFVDAELPADLGVGVAVGDQGEDVAATGGQGFHDAASPV